MVEIYLLKQLLALQQYTTLVAAAEALHLTQPALTRSMKKLEEQTGISLFEREKKRISLNENGILVAEYAARILDLEQEMMDQLSLFNRSRRTLSFGSVVPGPIIEITSLLIEHLDLHISETIADETALLEGLRNRVFHLIILTHPIETAPYSSVSAGRERLYYCYENATGLPASGVFFRDIDGQSVLCPSQIGLWDQVIHTMLPNSHFIYQASDDEVNFLANHSSLPAFASDIGLRHGIVRGSRIAVPILDSEAEMDYYCVYLRSNQKLLRPILECIAAL